MRRIESSYVTMKSDELKLPTEVNLFLKGGVIKLPLRGSVKETLMNFGEALSQIRASYPEAFEILMEAGIEWIPKREDK